MGEVTRILDALGDGDEEAAGRLLEAVYEELRRLASARLARESPGPTLQATALVHEAYLRLFGKEGVSFENRAHFFGAAAEAMRRILVERARRRGSLKRGGDRQRVDLDESGLAVLPPPVELLAVDEALCRLESEDPAKAELVKLRYFAGLEIAEAARILGISRATADRHWAFARAWLYREIRKGDEPA
jgi:RNA polymerase sigma factor (TIGR02999 family)